MEEEEEEEVGVQAREVVLEKGEEEAVQVGKEELASVADAARKPGSA